MKSFHCGALLFAVLALMGCTSPASSGSQGEVTISIGPAESRSGLIDVTTAALRADLYDVILYNATHTYRALVTTSSTAAVLTNVVPGTYAVLVLAGKTNGATLVGGAPAAILLGSGDVPYKTNFATVPLVGTVANATTPTDGRGVVVAGGGNTAISVTLQNLVYTVTGTNTTGMGPLVAGVGSSFTVNANLSVFSNRTSASNASGYGPIDLQFYSSSVNYFGYTGAATFASSEMVGPSSLRGWGSYTLASTFNAPAVAGTSTYTLNVGNATSPGIGKFLFYNELSGSTTQFNLIPSQSGTPTNWFAPSDNLTVAMPAIKDVSNVAVPGSTIVNFSAPGAAVTIGWGTGR